MSFLSEVIPGVLLALVAAAIITGCVIALSLMQKNLTIEKLLSELSVSMWVYKDDAGNYILLVRHDSGPDAMLDTVYTTRGARHVNRKLTRGTSLKLTLDVPPEAVKICLTDGVRCKIYKIKMIELTSTSGEVQKGGIKSTHNTQLARHNRVHSGTVNSVSKRSRTSSGSESESSERTKENKILVITDVLATRERESKQQPTTSIKDVSKQRETTQDTKSKNTNNQQETIKQKQNVDTTQTQSYEELEEETTEKTTETITDKSLLWQDWWARPWLRDYLKRVEQELFGSNSDTSTSSDTIADTNENERGLDSILSGTNTGGTTGGGGSELGGLRNSDKVYVCFPLEEARSLGLWPSTTGILVTINP